MMFHDVKSAIVQTLGDAAASRFRVVGFQRQGKASDELLTRSRIVQVYYSDGAIDKGKSPYYGNKQHDCNFNIDLSVSAAASMDVSVLESDTATAQQRAAALLALREAAEMADESLDEFIDIVFGIMMDARNSDLGLGRGVISNRWISNIQKDTVLERGDLVVKTAQIKFSCRVVESVQGQIGAVPAAVVIDSSLPMSEVENFGVTAEIDNT